MIFHRLRVLSFSKSLLSIKSVSNTKSNVKEPNKCKGAPEVRLAVPLHVFQVTNTKVSKDNTKTSGSDRLPVRPRLEFKSKSETLRISSRKHRKRRNRKTLSLNDIKISLKDFNLNFIRQKFHSLKKENINKNVARKRELDVLYIAELNHRHRKRKTHRRKPKTPQSSCDLFGFYSHNRIFDPHTFHHKYHKGCTPFNKLRSRSALKRLKIREAQINCPYTHHPLKVVTTSSINSDSHTTCCTNPLHYNLLQFPKGSKIRQSRNKFLRRQCRRKSWANKKVGCYFTVSDKSQKESSLLRVPVVRVDMAVSACGSRKRNTPTNGISNTIQYNRYNKCPSKELRDSGCTFKTPCNRRRRPSKHSLLKLSSLYHEMYSKLLKCSTHRTKKYLTKNVFKYIFLFLLVIVWSPCIMGIAVGWLLSSPLRPQHIVINDKDEKTRESIYDCFCSECRFDWWAKYIVNIKCISLAIKHFFFNIFRRQKCEPEDLPRCRSHPDPRLKYSLYHADGRGWVIKADRPGARVPSQQNRFKRAFHNMFCDYDCSNQDSFKNTNINGGGASLNKSVSHGRMSANPSFRACGNPILSKCGYSNKHVEGHIEPKTHNSEDDYKPLAQPTKLKLVESCLKSMIQQKSQETSKYKLKQSNEAVQSYEAVCKKTVQQQLDNAEKPSDIDHTLEPDKNDCFQKPTKSSEMSNCSRLGTSDKSVIDKLINNISGHKDIALSGLEVASKIRVCGKSECKMLEDTSTSRVCGKSVPLPQESSSKSKFHHPEDTSHEKMERSLKSDTQPGPELVQPLPVGRRSVLKSSSIRSSPKPDRVTIAEGDTSSKSAIPQKILNSNTDTKQRSLEKPKVPIPKPQPERKTKDITLTSKKQGQSVGGDLDKKVPKKEQLGNFFRSLGRRTADSIGSRTKPHRITEAKTKEKENIYIKINNTKSNQTQQRGLALPKRKLKDKTNRKIPEKKKLPVKRKFYQKKKIPFWHKVRNWFRNLGWRSANSITKCDRYFHSALYPVDVGCADQYLITLRSRPWFWVYHCCPKKYPSFLRTYYCTKNCCFFFLVSVSFCFWAPLLMCCYLCYELCAMCC